ncbi:unnamed protein product [Adineta ricciae]|uniref:Uncharacterized protein n=1 Tax=Adineta ricciae TaxID=249248 RepID=A0A814AFW5_ADIRI|nr:unnamed protein product [Adineta ricciae]
MQPSNYIAYPNQITQPFRPIPPANFLQGSPPFVNQSFDRFNGMRQTIRPYRYVSRPLQPYQNNPGYPGPRKLPPRLQYQLKLIPPRPPIAIAYETNHKRNVAMPTTQTFDPLPTEPSIARKEKRRSLDLDLDSDISSLYGTQPVVTDNANRNINSKMDFDMRNRNTLRVRSKKQSVWGDDDNSADEDHSHTCGNHIPTRP